MSQPDIFISVVIPAYNESIRIVNTLEQLKQYLEGKSFKAELIVVDDGSSDDTPSVVEARRSDFEFLKVLSYPQNQGKGYAVKFGFVNAVGEFVLMADADGATPFKELDRLLPYAEKGADVVIGSRAVKSEDVVLKTLPHRKLMGRVFSFFVSTVLGLSLKDTQCGFKLFQRKRSQKIFDKQSINGFGFDVELLFLAKMQNLSVKEVAISWNEVRGSKVNLVRDSLKMFFDLLLIRFNQIKGIYR